MLPRLIVVTDDRPIEALQQVLSGVLSVSSTIAVQLRRPSASARALLAEAALLAVLCRKYGNRLFINGRLDVALALGLDFHAPAHGFSPAAARAQLGPERLISTAVHDRSEVEAASGADLALLSPVFPTASKPGAPALGADGFRALATSLNCPAFALGGVDSENVALLGRPAGVAVIRSVLDAADPPRAAAALLEQL